MRFTLESFATPAVFRYKCSVTPQWSQRIGTALRVFGVFACVAGVLLAIVSVRALLAGLYPEDGNGSLGHFGAILAGVIGLFLTLISELLGIYMMQKARKISLQNRPPLQTQD